MGNVIEIAGLRKTYRRRRGTVVAVERLDLAVPEGGVFGFLGPNGSGKTTTIRCLLGLVRPSAGDLRLLGRRVPDDLSDAIRRTGSVVETPALFPTMTGRENLRLLASIDGLGPRRVAEVLELVGLTARAEELVRGYSLGMRQRLGLAAAMLKDPELLVLDEPANGLDPAGMRQVRDLLRTLAKEGRTVFVSSHILSEIEQMCDRVAILGRGRCIAQGTVEEIVSSAGRRPSVVVEVPDLDTGRRVLLDAGLPVRRVDGTLRVDIAPEAAATVTRLLAAADQWVTVLRPVRPTLEDVFLELVANDLDDPRGAAPPTGSHGDHQVPSEAVVA